MIGQFGTFGEPLAQHGTGQQDPVFLGMRAGLEGGHAVAFVTVEGPVDLERFTEEGLARLGGHGNLVEDGLGFEHAVKIAHAGMVAADDHLGAAVVLTESSVQQRFPGTGITHIQRISALND